MMRVLMMTLNDRTDGNTYDGSTYDSGNDGDGVADSGCDDGTDGGQEHSTR